MVIGNSEGEGVSKKSFKGKYDGEQQQQQKKKKDNFAWLWWGFCVWLPRLATFEDWANTHFAHGLWYLITCNFGDTLI